MNQETKVANWFSTELSSSVTDSTLTFPVDSIGSLTSPALIVIDPDNAAKREVVRADGTWGASSFVASALSRRGLAGSASGAQAHDAGTVVEVRPLAQHIEDLNDRVEGHAHGGGTDGSDISANVDHGTVGGLGDDDHTQYHNNTRHDAHDHSTAAASIASADLADHTKATHDDLALDHGLLTGLADDDHTNLFNSTRHDAHDHSAAAASIASADLADHTKATHDALALDHGSLGGRADDDHTQYLNTTRHGTAYHTHSQYGGVDVGIVGSGTAHSHSTASRTVSSTISIPTDWNGYTLVVTVSFFIRSTSANARRIEHYQTYNGVNANNKADVVNVGSTTTFDRTVSSKGVFTSQTATGSRTFSATILINSADAAVTTDEVVVEAVAYRTS